MTTPKYRENGHDKARRLNLGKPHIFFCRTSGEWMRGGGEQGLPMEDEALNFCISQDARWTPRGQS